MGLLCRPGAHQRLPDRVERRADRTSFVVATSERRLGVVVHAAIGCGLDQERRRRTEVQLPVEFDDVVEPLGLRRRADVDAIRRKRREFGVHLPGNRVLDCDDVLEIGETIAELWRHQIAAVGMAPQGDADVDRFRDRPVVAHQRLVLRLGEVKGRRVHDDVVRPTRFGVAGEVEHNVEVLVRARHDRLGIAPAGLDRKLEGPLAFVDRHREELALLPADEEALDAEVLGPVADILGEAVLVDSELVVERHEGGRPDTGHGCSGVFFGPVSGVLHAPILLFGLRRSRCCGTRS